MTSRTKIQLIAAICALVLLAHPACNPYNPKLENVACGVGGLCPPGLSCDPGDGICRAPGNQDPDAGGGPCTEAIRVSATVNGQAISDGRTEPLLTVAPGDSIALSAVGSCVLQGTIAYAWTIESQDGSFDLAATSDNGVDSETLSVFAERAGIYRIALTVSNGGIAEQTLDAIAFEVPAWTVVDSFPAAPAGGPEFRDVSIGDGFLWVASKEGAYRVSLADPVGGTIEEVNSVIDTGGTNVALPSNSRATFYETDRKFAWFSNEASDTDIYRGNFQNAIPIGQAINLSGAASGQIRDIAPLSPNGVVVASQAGVFSSPGSSVFTPVDTTIDARAVLSRAGELWVGSDGVEGLRELTSDQLVDVFPGSLVDDKIRRIILVDDRLWIASLDQGIARVNPADTSDKTIYNLAGGHLPSNNVQFLAAEASGDIWAGTTGGVARYKADRDLWVIFTQDGLEGHIDANTIAVDESNGRRTILVGSKGMAVLSVPTLSP